MASIDLALKHAAQRIALGADVREEAARAWAQIDRGRIAESWLELLITRVLLAIFGGQRAAAAMAQPYAGAAAASSGLSTATAGVIQAASFAGTAADGRSMLTLMLQPVITALTAIGAKVPVDEAMALGAAQLDNIVHTEIADAGRTADQVAMIATPSVDGYIRVVVGDTCSRCIILAGRWYPYSQFFERHPSCDCVQMPAKEAEAAGLIQDPREIYESLTTEQRTKAGWSEADQFAIDEGADIVQVTNVRRKENGRGGVYTAGGKQYTREGTTRAGLYGGYDIDPETGKITRRPRGSGKKPPRLTPQQIFEDADSREDAILKLRQYGYLLGPARDRTEPAVEDDAELGITAARERQAAIDGARDRADALAGVWESLLDEPDAAVIRRSLGAALRRKNLQDDPLMAAVLRADDEGDIRDAVEQAERELGLTRLGGDTVTIRTRFGEFEVQRAVFDPAVHNVIGGERIRRGDPADIVKPGYQFEYQGETILLRKADVQPGDDPVVEPEPQPAPPAPEPADYTGPTPQPPAEFTHEQVQNLQRLYRELWKNTTGTMTSFANDEEISFMARVREEHPWYHKFLTQQARIEKSFGTFHAKNGGGLSPDELKTEMSRRLKEATSGKPIGIRVDETILKSIFTDGRYKTQHETGKASEGAFYNPEVRAESERSKFGTPPNEALQRRPIYGYLGMGGRKAAGGIYTDRLTIYGDVAIYLKDSVRRRSTVTVGDSSNEQFYSFPTPLNDPTWLSYGSGDDHAAPQLRRLDRDYTSRGFKENLYVEVQVHGGVSVFDIDEVVFTSEPSQEWKDRLDEFEIKWSHGRKRKQAANEG